MADDTFGAPKRGRGRPRGVRSTTRSKTTTERGTTRKRGRGRGRGTFIEDSISIEPNQPNETFEQPRPPSPTEMDLGSEISHPMSPQLSRAPSPTPSLASISSGRRLGSLSHDLPALEDWLQ